MLNFVSVLQLVTAEGNMTCITARALGANSLLELAAIGISTVHFIITNPGEAEEGPWFPTTSGIVEELASGLQMYGF